jgi:signal transduction histidine kinase
VEFSSGEIDPSLTLPPELFDSVLDNLLQNALRKRQMEGYVSVAVSFKGTTPISLTVCDDGNAAPDAVAKQLLSAPVPSESGLGIGLYQANRQAKELGYYLELASNRHGEVCFRLSKLQMDN